jgi:hypothetical protein
LLSRLHVEPAPLPDDELAELLSLLMGDVTSPPEVADQ